MWEGSNVQQREENVRAVICSPLPSFSPHACQGIVMALIDVVVHDCARQYGGDGVDVQAYQVFKARASGADCILLIAAVLPNSDMAYLIRVARQLGLQCIIEVGGAQMLGSHVTSLCLGGMCVSLEVNLRRVRQSGRAVLRAVEGW